MPLGFLSNTSQCVFILYFSQSQTPIASLISLSSKPEDKVLAPLTSTPVTALSCANHTTPKSLCGPVNIESVRSAEVLCMHVTSEPAFVIQGDLVH